MRRAKAAKDAKAETELETFAAFSFEFFANFARQ